MSFASGQGDEISPGIGSRLLVSTGGAVLSGVTWLPMHVDTAATGFLEHMPCQSQKVFLQTEDRTD
jgi:hypothetical protein